MRALFEFLTVIVVCPLTFVALEKMSVDSPWSIGVSVAAGLFAGRLVNPNSYKHERETK